MRMKIIAAAALALLAAAPAAADITARYATGFGRGPGMPTTIRVNARGDNRVDTDNQMAVLTIDGVTYLLAADLAGTYAIRFDDMAAVMGEQFRAMMGEDAPAPAAEPAAAPPAQEPVEGGTETVAGYAGTQWQLQPGGGGPAAFPADAVLSTDPRLAPLARAMAQLAAASERGMVTMTGAAGAWPGSSRELGQILRRGALLRMGQMLRLESVDIAPVEASLFVLPSAPLTREQYAARRGWASPARH